MPRTDNPLDQYVTTKPGSWQGDFRVPPLPKMREAISGKSLADALAQIDGQNEEWRKNLEQSISERIRQSADTTTAAAAPTTTSEPTTTTVVDSSTATALAAHIASTITHGTASDIVGVSDEQAIEQKTLGLTAPRQARFTQTASSNSIAATEIVHVPNGFNMIIAGGLTIDGVLVVDGTLFLL